MFFKPLISSLVYFSHTLEYFSCHSPRNSKNISSSTPSLSTLVVQSFTPIFLCITNPEISVLVIEEHSSGSKKGKETAGKAFFFFFFFADQGKEKAENTYRLFLSSNNHNTQTPTFYNTGFVKNIYILCLLAKLLPEILEG